MCTSVMRTPSSKNQAVRTSGKSAMPEARMPRRVRWCRRSQPTPMSRLRYRLTTACSRTRAYSRHWPGTPLSARLAAVGEPVSRSGDDVAHRRGHQHFAGPGERRHPRADVHGHARRYRLSSAAAHLDLAGVNAHPHLDAQHADRVDDGVGAGDRGARAAECRDESVSGRVDFAPGEPLQLVPHDGVVVVEQVAPAVDRRAAAARSVEPTMSVNTIVVSRRSASEPPRTPVMNSSISSSIGRGVAHPVQRVFARQFDDARSGDALGKVVTVRDRG